MRRLPTLCTLLLLACRPSQADVDALKSELAKVSAQQAELLERLDAEDDSEPHDHVNLEYELAALAQGLEMAHRRIEDLEGDVEAQAKAPTPAPTPRGPARPDPAARYRIELGDAHTRGSDEALVTVVAWVDYQCPFSDRVQGTLDDLRAKYGDEVRIAAKHNPLSFHRHAMAAALAAEAAGRQNKFWKMHAKLFENQRDLDDAKIRRFAKKLRLDVDQFKADLRDAALKAKIKGDQAQAMQFGARGTPAFFINGRFLSGAQPLLEFEELIDEELATARALTSKGVPEREVYDKVIADGLAKVE